MDLKEYLAIFKKYFKTFLITVIIFILAGVLFQLLRPLSYKSSLTLSVTRTGTQQTSDYRYDDFYRLQADEKFADTVVRWINSPRLTTDTLNDSKITTSGMSSWRLSRFFKAQRLSSQVIQVTYATGDSATAQGVSRSLIKVVNREAERLNQDQNEENWFEILESDPVVKENKLSWYSVIISMLILGVFIGIWTVLFRRYLE